MPPDLSQKRTSIQTPWQNGTAERWIGSCRREILDHIIPVNEPHLRRLIRDYVRYHQEDRVHGSLNKDTLWFAIMLYARNWLTQIGMRRNNQNICQPFFSPSSASSDS